jgi:hypothetical protein
LPGGEWKQSDVTLPSGDPRVFVNMLLTESEAKEVIEKNVRKTCFRLRGYAPSLAFTSFKQISVPVVILETYVQTRKVFVVEEPYRQLPLDDERVGPPPPIWSIPVSVPPPFTSTKETMKVPHTDRVSVCEHCQGKRYRLCYDCNGLGFVMCTRCGGSGHRKCSRTSLKKQQIDFRSSETEPCRRCRCTGRVQCPTCHGRRELLCSVCDGCGSLLKYDKLEVTFETIMKDSVVDNLMNPKLKKILSHKKIKKKATCLVFQEEGPTLLPGQRTFVSTEKSPSRLNESVNTEVNRLLEQSKFSNMVAHWQRVRVLELPVYEATYLRNQKEHYLWIVGTERKLYAPGYPLSYRRVFVFVGIIALVFVALGITVVVLLYHFNVIR